MEVQEIQWQGPFSWPGFENKNHLSKIPDLEAVYLWTFQYLDGYLVYAAGITNSTKKRFQRHTLNYKSGDYTVLDVKAAEAGLRKEIWQGWEYAKSHPEDFQNRKVEILKAAYELLSSFRIFVAQVSDKRTRARFEAAIMQNIYTCEEYWAGLADKGMFLSRRYDYEIPIDVKNLSKHKIYGLPDTFKI